MSKRRLERSLPEIAELTDAEVMARTVMTIPEGMVQALSQVHLLGPTITQLLMRLISAVRIYNVNTTPLESAEFSVTS